MKKYIGVLAVLSMLICLSVGSATASYTMYDSLYDRKTNDYNYEQHPEKGPAIHYATVELVCRDNKDPEILLYRLKENNKTVGYVYARGFKYLQESIEIFEQSRHVHYIWSYKDINSNGSFKRNCS